MAAKIDGKCWPPEKRGRGILQDRQPASPHTPYAVEEQNRPPLSWPLDDMQADASRNTAMVMNQPCGFGRLHRLPLHHNFMAKM
jgi:hypothetical protein